MVMNQKVGSRLATRMDLKTPVFGLESKIRAAFSSQGAKKPDNAYVQFAIEKQGRA